ncbi:ATP-dependent helicase [Soehngenia saccharolytica]|nr:ATP-dependent helicase [Soehngenia saccharolytica]
MQLSEEQKSAVSHLYGPALILAVPGSGKTTVLIHRIYNLVNINKIRPNKILSITFSKASALDMKMRYQQLFHEDSMVPPFMTIHAFCYEVIRAYSKKANKNYFLIENEATKINKYTLISSIYLNINKNMITEEKLENFFSYAGYIKNMCITPEEFIKNKKIDVENFIDIFYLYEKYKKDNNYIDFDDMLSMAYEILSNDKKILNYYKNKYDFIQVDEGQDTSIIQFKIINLISSPSNNIFIVADDDQSIYGFRGAYPKQLLEFNKMYPNGKVYYLKENYRSSKNIVNASYSFISNNINRYDKDIFTRNPYKSPVKILKFKSILDQYGFIIDEINNNLDKSMAVLYRNNLSSIGLIYFLTKKNYKFYMRDFKLKFFNHWLLKDIFNFIEFSRKPTDVQLYSKIYYKKKGYISKKMVAWAYTHPSSRSVFSNLLSYPGLSEFYKTRIRELELDFKKISNLNIKDAIDYIVFNLNYHDYIKENSNRLGYTYETIMQMIFYLKLIAEDVKSVDEFRSKLTNLEKIIKDSSKEKSNLLLSTIHGAKGLEFDKVIMIDLINGQFPSSSSLDLKNGGNIFDFEEERRLFYVGMTRAKEELTLTCYNVLDSTFVKQSEFIDELNKINSAK